MLLVYANERLFTQGNRVMTPVMSPAMAAWRSIHVAQIAICALLCATFGTLASSIVHADEKFKAVTTFTVIADMARNVAGDAAVVESITKPGSEIHRYSPTPRDILRAQDADLVLWNGMNLELWFAQFFDHLNDGLYRRHPLKRSAGAWHSRGQLCGKAQSPCLDVTQQCDDLCRQHRQRFLQT